MAFLQDKINSFQISDNSKKFLEAIINPHTSILKDYYCENLFNGILNAIKRDNSLLSYLLNLVDNSEDFYIKLPYYINLKPRKLKSTEFLLKENGKYGILLNIISNRKTFNFSIRLRDMTIIVYDNKIKKQTRGSYRSFTLTDKYGNIAENWKTMKVYTIDEEKKIFDNHDKSEIITQQLFVGNDICNLINDIRYFLLKLYVKRLELERDYWEEVQKNAIERKSNLDYEYEKRQAQKVMEEIQNGNN